MQDLLQVVALTNQIKGMAAAMTNLRLRKNNKNIADEV
jgi:hypothetical protein